MANLLAIKNLLSEKLSAGINLYLGISGCHLEPLSEFIHKQTAEISLAHARSLPAGFSHSRQLYRSFRIDPTKNRPSSEALWRRLRDRNDFPAINPLVDLTNLLSLKFQVCYGLYDLEKVCGQVVVTQGDISDQYLGIRKDNLNFNGKIVLRDDQGAFGNPSADSLRASVNESSYDVMQILFFLPNDQEKEKILAETLTVFQQFFTMAESRPFFI